MDHVEIRLLDDPVQVHADEVLAGGRAPMTEQEMLYMRERQRTLQRIIIEQLKLADRKIVGGVPAGIDFVERFRSKFF